jgi:dihydrofolate reductase
LTTVEQHNAFYTNRFREIDRYRHDMTALSAWKKGCCRRRVCTLSVEGNVNEQRLSKGRGGNVYLTPTRANIGHARNISWPVVDAIAVRCGVQQSIKMESQVSANAHLRIKLNESTGTTLRSRASELLPMAITSSVYIATSLDGYIAREDGSIDWLMEANTTVPAGEDCGYAAFMSSVDVLIMGRNTYEQVAGFEPWPYEGKRVVVLTSREIDFRQGANIQLEKSSETPQELLKRLSLQGCKHAYVDGGKVIQSFLSNGLIDRLTITTVPVLIGGGRPLFGTVLNDMKLKLAFSKAYEFGFIQTTYVAQ